MKTFRFYLILLMFVITSFGESLNMDESTIIGMGDSAAKLLAKTLLKNLTDELKTGDHIGAMSYCNEHAQILTKTINDSLPPGIKVNRTSMKYRNPVNKPTEIEQEVLSIFESKINKNQPIPDHYYIEKVSPDSSKIIYHYFKPIKTTSLCLDCHGQKADIAPEITDLLKEKYPNDLAVGYKSGDFRGLIHVTIENGVISK